MKTNQEVCMTGFISSNIFNHPFFRDPLQVEPPLKRLTQLSSLSDLDCEVYKENGQFIAVFNLPGHTGMNDISADVDKEAGLLKVESKKAEENKKEENGRIYYHKGESRRSFTLHLPKDIDFDSAQAKCENGQLKVTFNIKTEAQVENNKKFSIPIESQTERV